MKNKEQSGFVLNDCETAYINGKISSPPFAGFGKVIIWWMRFWEYRKYVLVVEYNKCHCFYYHY